MHFYKPDSLWLTKYDAEISSIAFPAKAVSGQPVGVPGTLYPLCGEEIQQGKGDGEQRGLCSHIAVVGGWGWAVIPQPILPWLVGSACEHPGWYLLAFPAGNESFPRWHCCPTMCWGPGSDFGHTNHSLGFFLGLLPLQGTAGISWAVMGFGDSHSHPHSRGRVSSHQCA